MYSYLTKESIEFWIFWKYIGFLVVFEFKYGKQWLHLRFRVQSLYNKGKDWGDELRNLIHKKKIDNHIIMEFQNNPQKFLNEKKFQDIDYQELQMLYEKLHDNQQIQQQLQYTIKEEKLQELQQYFNDRFQNHYQKNINEYQLEKTINYKSKWPYYLNFILILNIFGIVGYSFLLLDYNLLQHEWFDISKLNSPNDLYTWRYVIGLIFTYTEYILFDVGNAFIVLHCFFMEKFECEKLKIKQQQPQINQNN